MIGERSSRHTGLQPDHHFDQNTVADEEFLDLENVTFHPRSHAVMTRSEKHVTVTRRVSEAELGEKPYRDRPSLTRRVTCCTDADATFNSERAIDTHHDLGSFQIEGKEDARLALIVHHPRQCQTAQTQLLSFLLPRRAT